jgi:hypothetical protein
MREVMGAASPMRTRTRGQHQASTAVRRRLACVRQEDKETPRREIRLTLKRPETTKLVSADELHSMWMKEPKWSTPNSNTSFG